MPFWLSCRGTVTLILVHKVNKCGCSSNSEYIGDAGEVKRPLPRLVTEESSDNWVRRHISTRHADPVEAHAQTLQLRRTGKREIHHGCAPFYHRRLSLAKDAKVIAGQAQ